MPTYPHLCKNCQHEWDEIYGIKDAPPTICPNCKTEGMVTRLIGGGSGRGIVTLSGKDLGRKIKADAKAMTREAVANERVMANLVGEDRYHSNELLRGKIRRRFSGG